MDIRQSNIKVESQAKFYTRDCWLDFTKQKNPAVIKEMRTIVCCIQFVWMSHKPEIGVIASHLKAWDVLFAAGKVVFCTAMYTLAGKRRPLWEASLQASRRFFFVFFFCLRSASEETSLSVILLSEPACLLFFALTLGRVALLVTSPSCHQP